MFLSAYKALLKSKVRCLTQGQVNRVADLTQALKFFFLIQKIFFNYSLHSILFCVSFRCIYSGFDACLPNPTQGARLSGLGLLFPKFWAWGTIRLHSKRDSLKGAPKPELSRGASCLAAKWEDCQRQTEPPTLASAWSLLQAAPNSTLSVHTAIGRKLLGCWDLAPSYFLLRVETSPWGGCSWR